MADEKLMYTVDKDDNVVYVRTLGKAVKNNAGQDLGAVEAGAQVNKLETLKLKFGETETAITITGKEAVIDLSAYAKSATTLAGYGIGDAYTKAEVDAKVDAKLTSAYKAAGSVADVASLGALTSANEGNVYNLSAAFTTTADFVEGAGKKHPAGTNVAIVKIGDAYKYDVMAGFIDTSDYDSHLANNTIHITAEERNTWNAKQNAITASNKLAANLVADDADHRFVSDAEKATWNGKQDEIADLATIRSNATAGKAAKDAVDAMGDIVSHNAAEFQNAIDETHKLNADLVDDSASTNKFVTSALINKINSALQAADVDQTYSATSQKAQSGVAVAQAIATITGGDYLRYKEVIE